MISAGRVLIIGKGEWNALTDYQQLDMVSYDNKAYLARQASVGVNPSTDVSMTYWQPFGSAAEPDQETIIKNSEGELAVNIDGDTIIFDQEAGKLKATLGVSALKDITILNPSNNQVLRYNSTTRKWENKSLGSAADKSSTNELSQGNQSLIESGAVFDEFQNVYKVNDQAITSVASDDLMPIYDTSATGKKKIAVSNFIGGLVSNPNLLDNPWFTVNQRGQSSYMATGYTVDRWRCEDLSDSGNTISISDDGLVCTASGTPSKSTWLRQYFDGSVFDGSVFTVSMIIESSVAIKTYLQVRKTDNTNLIDSSGVDVLANTPTIIKASANVQKINGNCYIRAFFNYSKVADAIVKIKAIKLEKGSVSTLAQDTAPNYATELLKCQRYYCRIQKRDNDKTAVIGYGYIQYQTTNDARITIILPTEMRTTPSVSFSEKTRFGINVSGSSSSLTNNATITVGSISNNMVFLQIVDTSFSFASLAMITLTFNKKNDYIEFSADL